MERVEIQGVLAKDETSYKTDPVPAVGSDEVHIEEFFYNNLTWGYRSENRRDNAAGAGLGRHSTAEPVGRWAQIELLVALKGTAAAFAEGTEEPEWLPLAKACALDATFDDTAGTEAINLKLKSTGHDSCAIYAYGAGMEWKILGCHGNLEILATPGELLLGRFTIQGVLDNVDEAALPAFVYPQKSILPPTVKNSGLTLNGFDPSDFAEFALDLGVRVVERPSGNDADGHAGYAITGWDPAITTTIERPPLASFNPWALRSAATRFAWDIGPIGSDQYNKVAISGPAGRIFDVPHGEQDGLAMIDLSIACHNTDVDTDADAIDIELS